MSDTTSDPAAIERDLEQTRSRLDHRLEELQSRLSPGQVIDEAMAYFRTSQGADFGRNLAESVRDNPLPAALVGIGIVWLMASGRRTEPRAAPRDGAYDELHARVRTAGAGVMRLPEETETSWRDRVDEARGRVLGLTRQAQESTESFGQRITDALSAAKDGLTRQMHDLHDRAAAGTGAARDAVGTLAGQARDTVGDWAESGRAAMAGSGGALAGLAENPVVLGAIGLAAGALLGTLVPQSAQEERALADTAGAARETLRGAAQQAMDRGRQAAQAALDAGRETAQQEGLAGQKSAGELFEGARSGALADSGKKVVQAALRATDKAARGEAGEQQQPG